MDHDGTRRRFLRLAGVGSGLALAGCLGTGADASEGGTVTTSSVGSSPSETPTGTESRPATATDTDTEGTPPPMSAVFHFSSSADAQLHAVANVRNLLADDTVDLGTVYLVANGHGIELLTADRSNYPDQIASLQELGAAFRVCQNSMDALDVTAADLLPGVTVVPSGVGELTRLQVQANCAYIKTP